MPWSDFTTGLREGFGGHVTEPTDDAQLAEYREVLAAYVERDEEHQRQLREMAQHIAALDAENAEFRHTLTEMMDELAHVRSTRDRYQANGKRISAEKREVEFLLQFPGVKAALFHFLHSDHHPGANAGERRARDEAVAKIAGIYKRLAAAR